MKRPFIGINTGLLESDGNVYYRLDQNYVKAILAAGGIPVLLPFFANSSEASAYLAGLDGVLFTGGADINPKHWREKTHPKSKLLPERKEKSDFHAMNAALKTDQPMLGICYGMQLMNVALGGSLHQHLPDLDRDVEHRKGAVHHVKVERGTRTGKILGRASASVKSYHHQGIHELGRGLRVTATAPDGIVEGVEAPERRFALAVQWHPERIQNKPEQRALIRAFVDAAR